VDFPNRLAHVNASEGFDVTNAISQLAGNGYEDAKVVTQ
jgi:hypothetical protein